MIEGMDHVGIGVRDLDRALASYRELLGTVEDQLGRMRSA